MMMAAPRFADSVLHVSTSTLAPPDQLYEKLRGVYSVFSSQLFIVNVFFTAFDLFNFLVILSCAFDLAQTGHKGLGPWYLSFDFGGR